MKQFEVIFSNACNGVRKMHVILMMSNMFTYAMCAYAAKNHLV
jgi:hypothetical protein